MKMYSLFSSFPSQDVMDNEVRLVGGLTNCSGRVEILHNGTWGAICSSSWDLNDASVVCRQMGCGHAIAAANNAQFGQGSGLIWMSSFGCSGTENSLQNCPHHRSSRDYCQDYSDAGVLCERESICFCAPNCDRFADGLCSLN